MTGICPQGHHDIPETTHCGENGCTCECELCVARRQWWAQAAEGHLKCIGGPVDGAYVLRSKYPTLQKDGDIVRLVLTALDPRVHYYRLHAGALHFIRTAKVAYFKGGPLDGKTYPEEKLTHVADGGFVAIARENQVASYRRLGLELHFDGYIPAEEFRSEPGFTM